MLTKEQSLRRNKNIISSLLLLLVPLGGYLVYKDLNKTPTFYGGGTLTNYERTLKLDKQYSYEEGKIQNVPDTEYLGYFTFLKDGFNEHTISLTSEDKPKSIHKHVHFDTDRDSVTNTFTTDGIVIDTNYKTTETKNKTLGAPTPNIKQTFILRNTTDETKETNFTSTTRLNSNTITYNGRTITITDTPTILRAEEKTASIPEFASDIGYENPEETESFSNYTHTYRTPAFLTFETDEGTAVYDWRDAKHLNHTVTLYEHDNSYYLSFAVDDITIEPQSSFTIDPAYGLDEFQNYDVRYDGQVGIERFGVAPLIGDINNDGFDDLITTALWTPYNSGDVGSAYIFFGTSTVASGTLAVENSSNFNVRIDADSTYAAVNPVGIGDVNGDGENDLILKGDTYAWVLLSTQFDSYGTTTGNVLNIADTDSFNIRFDGAGVDDAAIADMNNDTYGDLLLSDNGFAGESSSEQGGVWVMFSTLLDDYGTTTGNVLSISDSGSYNVRLTGKLYEDFSQAGIKVADIDGDNKLDLVTGSNNADNNGSDSGSIWVFLSNTFIDVGVTTGNIKYASSTDDFHIRWDGKGAYNRFGDSINLGDINGDSVADITVGNDRENFTGTYSGAIWVMFSTLVDDFGTTTGNILLINGSTSTNVRIDGGEPGHDLGDNSTIGDVNGDGLSDLIATAWDTDYGGSSAGSAWLLFSTFFDDFGVSTGNILDLSTTTHFNVRYDGGAATDQVGRTCKLVGDVDGDSVDDLTLCGNWADNNGDSSGSAWVLPSTMIDDVGTTTGNIKSLGTGSNYFIRYDGPGLDYQFTVSGGAVGDVNGDGLGDLVLGSYFGDDAGTDSGSLWVMYSTLIDDESGTGNVRSMANSNYFSTRYDGGTSNIKGLGSTGFMAVGDVNGDSFADLVIGAESAAGVPTNSGAVFVVFGDNDNPATSTFNLNDTYNIRYYGSADDDIVTAGSVHIGDVNGDGLGDLLVSAPNAAYSGTAGSLWVLFSTLVDDVGTTKGNDKPLTTASNYNIRYDGPDASSNIGLEDAVAIGDVNGDGLNDLVIGAYEYNAITTSAGSAWVMYSTLIDDVGVSTGNTKPLSTATNYNVRYDAGHSFDYLTYGGLLIADVDTDGNDDLLLGGYRAGHNGSYSGSLWVMYSTLIDDETGTGNTKDLTVSGNYNIRFDGATGDSIAREDLQVYDMNADGLNDLIIGANLADNNGLNTGSAYILYSTVIDDTGTTTGNIRPFSTSTNYNIRIDNYESSRLFGRIIGGDVNSNGIGDIVVVNGSDVYGDRISKVWIILDNILDNSGTTTGNVLNLASSTDFTARYLAVDQTDYISNDGQLFIADMNTDGFTDLIFGSGYQNNTGGAWVLYSTLIDDFGESTGNEKSLATSSDYSIRYDGANTFDYLTKDGAMLVEDLNGDLQPELFLGASGVDYGGYNAGALWIIYGTPPPKYKAEGSIQISGAVSFE